MLVNQTWNILSYNLHIISFILLYMTKFHRQSAQKILGVITDLLFNRMLILLFE